MLLKLTSSAAEFSGKPIVINSEYILSILENDVTNENGLLKVKLLYFARLMVLGKLKRVWKQF